MKICSIFSFYEMCKWKLLRLAKTQKFNNILIWRDCAETGTLRCWWGCKFIRPLWTAIWQCLPTPRCIYALPLQFHLQDHPADKPAVVGTAGSRPRSPLQLLHPPLASSESCSRLMAATWQAPPTAMTTKANDSLNQKFKSSTLASG